jgi:hypothetical protein
MLWFFDRDDEALQLETRFDNETSEFVATVNYPDGSQRVERFQSIEDFGEWLRAFDRTLREQHWDGRSGPVILPYGWPKKRLS